MESFKESSLTGLETSAEDRYGQANKDSKTIGINIFKLFLRNVPVIFHSQLINIITLLFAYNYIIYL